MQETRPLHRKSECLAESNDFTCWMLLTSGYSSKPQAPIHFKPSHRWTAGMGFRRGVGLRRGSKKIVDCGVRGVWLSREHCYDLWLFLFVCNLASSLLQPSHASIPQQWPNSLTPLSRMVSFSCDLVALIQWTDLETSLSLLIKMSLFKPKTSQLTMLLPSRLVPRDQ